MTAAPLLSYVVLSFNYANYIGQTLKSILSQTVQDFEIIVVDDCSSDRSCEIVEAFNDKRISLLRNPRNLGGAASYNRAVEAARGEWLVNLDADDWILPTKAEAQLGLVSQQPTLDVIGTWVSFVDRDGARHEEADTFEAETNQHWDLNAIVNWIGRNALCRSSTMVRCAAHRQFGLDDETMVRAPDYELWTRALHNGCKFAVLPEKLTCYRLHAGGVTHGDRLQTFLEMTWAARQNLVPAVEQRQAWSELHGMAAWLMSHTELKNLSGGARERLFGLLFAPRHIKNYDDFSRLLGIFDLKLETLGRRILEILRAQAEIHTAERQRETNNRDKLEADIRAYIEARDFWKAQCDRFEAETRSLLDRCVALEEKVASYDEAGRTH